MYPGTLVGYPTGVFVVVVVVVVIVIVIVDVPRITARNAPRTDWPAPPRSTSCVHLAVRRDDPRCAEPLLLHIRGLLSPRFQTIRETFILLFGSARTSG